MPNTVAANSGCGPSVSTGWSGRNRPDSRNSSFRSPATRSRSAGATLAATALATLSASCCAFCQRELIQPPRRGPLRADARLAALLSTSLMMWKPNCVFTRSLICPGCIEKAACSNSGHHPAFRPKKSRSPPFAFDPSSSEYFFARAAKSAPGALACLRTSSACFRTAASSLPSVFSRMWLARTCSGIWNC